MARQVADLDVLRMYLKGVIDRAEHHADNVDQICLALAGAIIWRKDDDNILVFTREGEMKNTLWVHINKKKYAFSYNHENHTIEIREESTQGRTLFSCSNATPISDVKTFFGNLCAGLASQALCLFRKGCGETLFGHQKGFPRDLLTSPSDSWPRSPS